LPIRFWPRTIRWQMLAGLILLEVLSLGLFATLLIRQQNHDVHRRIAQRLAHETSSLAAQAKEALLQQRPRWVELSVKIAGESPSVAFAKITDPVGNILYVSAGEPEQVKLTTRERALIPTVHYEDPKVFVLAPHRVEHRQQPARLCMGRNKLSLGPRTTVFRLGQYRTFRHRLDLGIGIAGAFDSQLHFSAAGGPARRDPSLDEYAGRQWQFPLAGNGAE